MQFRGEILEGGYQLEDVIAADAEFAAFRVRVLGDASLDAMAHFYACDASAAGKQAAIWQSLGELRHPNLNTPLAAGQKDLAGGTAVYAVLKRTEERLSGALEDRALRPAEAGELTRSVVGALKALHERGLVHGSVAPEQVLATEDAILLSTEGVRREGAEPALATAKPRYVAPESKEQNTTPEADVWCLGATLFEALTRKECSAGCREEGARLPLPFGRIVQRCLESDPKIRAKLPEIAELYSAPAQQVPMSGRPSAREAPPPNPVFRAGSRRGWIYGAVALLVAIAIIAFARSGQRAAPVSTPPAKPAAAKQAWPTRTLAPEARVASTHRDSMRAEGRQTPATGRTVWRLILYTYDRPEDADARAQKINQQHPGLNAESFSPNGTGGPYLVVAGGQMDHDAAVRLRSKAVRLGLPHDAYIQNFRR